MNALVIILEYPSGVLGPASSTRYYKIQIPFDELVKKVPKMKKHKGKHVTVAYDSTDRRAGNSLAKEAYQALAMNDNEIIREFSVPSWGSQKLDSIPSTILELHVATLC